MTTTPSSSLPQAAPAQIPTPARGPVTPVPVERRAVAPDVARGLALLGIAIANAAVHLSGGAVGLGLRPVDSSALDRAVDGVVSLFVDRRTMPMFALLYGYGIGVVVRRRAAAWVPWPACRADLLRRAAVLVAFGAVHVVLLFEGDILGAYGLAGLAAVLLVRASDRTLLVTAAVGLPVAALLGGAMQGAVVLKDVLGMGALEVPPEESPLLAMAMRAMSGVVGAPLGAVIAFPLVLLGLWAARREVLERPADHVRLLRRTAVAGLTVSVLGGAPFATAVARLRDPSALDVFASAMLHELTGVAGGVAFAALVGWVVAVRGTTLATLGPAGRALRAVGTRSLTCYLLQSVLFVLPLAPWAGGLGEHLGSAQVVAWAVGVWLVTVAVAVTLEAAGRRGPAEVLYRRLVYPRQAVR
ncbi:DUF418 domain-containing protein [Cellulomonas sp. Sa3CUA2]|uniref:DUF418 domain-containing protein n=1 Tax=Cellulomonas avistercoris TaxID=2762242 RepID=A0ABR8QGG1_9CELL|nr:DUF418 domain-containing protein [Cellulomonas avistercoris]MBD7919404.1 DUF418 domain-containing protein [Cellulomonas avistercoris]